MNRILIYGYDAIDIERNQYAIDIERNQYFHDDRYFTTMALSPSRRCGRVSHNRVLM
jgi:hypothetical protein